MEIIRTILTFLLILLPLIAAVSVICGIYLRLKNNSSEKNQNHPKNNSDL